jgi:hypothetical protein
MNGDIAAVTLQHEHASLLDALRRILLALIDGAFDVAQAGHLRLQVQLLEHARREEQELLSRLPDGARWPACVYIAEHLRIAALLRDAAEAVMGQPTYVTDATTRLRLLDAHHALRHLLEHHFAREEQGLFVEVCEGRDPRVG